MLVSSPWKQTGAFLSEKETAMSTIQVNWALGLKRLFSSPDLLTLQILLFQNLVVWRMPSQSKTCFHCKFLIEKMGDSSLFGNILLSNQKSEDCTRLRCLFRWKDVESHSDTHISHTTYIKKCVCALTLSTSCSHLERERSLERHSDHGANDHYRPGLLFKDKFSSSTQYVELMYLSSASRDHHRAKSLGYKLSFSRWGLWSHCIT